MTTVTTGRDIEIRAAMRRLLVLIAVAACFAGSPAPSSANAQHAGIQVLNTAHFPAGAGPLSHVHR